VGSYLDKLLRGIKQVYRNGALMPQQPVINMIGFAAVLDNPSLGSTDIYASSGSGTSIIIENDGSPLPIQPALNFAPDLVATNNGAATRIDVALNFLTWTKGGRMQGILHVTNAATGVLSPVAQIAMCESNTGTTVVSIGPASSFPGSTIPDGFSFMVADTGGAGATSPITITNASGLTIVDPNTLSTTAGSVVLSANYACAVWTWDATEQVYFVSGGTSVPRGFGSPIISSGGSLTLTNARRWGLFIANDLVSIPASPTPGLDFLLTHDQIRSMTSLAGAPVTIQRAGGSYVIQQPDGHQAGGVPLTAASVKGFTDGANYRLAHDGGSPGVMRCISSLSSP
jgi:hypothetical protein